MKKIFSLAALIILSVSQIFAVTLSDENISGVDRYAIYIGANNGGRGRDKLLYAGSDALSFKKTMAEIGGVNDSNCRTLIDPTKDAVDKALHEITAEINRNAGQAKRSEFIFYYSGHSDENALLLGNTKYDYSSLKAAISAVPSDIHVVILDSCYSGNFIRTKGGQKKKPFLLDDSTVVTGHAYLSSSSDNESSQESDEIESSYFTNAMITGLRGAADASGDNKVTLNELYSYAFNDTLSKTETSKAGPQHPNYNITLVGSGDLVLSDISSGESMLSLSKEAKGKFIIRDANEKLISEINKTAGQPIFMALPAGQYSAMIIEEYSTKQGTFILEKDQIYVLDQNSLSSIRRKTGRSRGSKTDAKEAADDGEILGIDDLADTSSKTDLSQDSEDDEELIESEEDDEEEEWMDYSQFFTFEGNKVFQLGIVPGFNAINPHAETVNIAFGFLGTTSHNVRGIQVSGLINMASGNILGVQSGAVGNLCNDDILGQQSAGVFNIVKDITGVQSAGVFNIANRIHGVQAAGVFNMTSDLRGFQAAGVYSMANEVHGVQASGFMNIAKDISGVQVAGFLNVAKKVRGVQIGIINIAEESDGVAIGLFNYIKDGVHDIGIAWDTDNMFDIFLRTGTKNLFFTLGYMSKSNEFFDKRNSEMLVSYAGFGTEFRPGNFRIDFEVLGKWVSDITNYYKYDDPYMGLVPSLRASVGFKIPLVTFMIGTTFDFFNYDFNIHALDLYEKKTVWEVDEEVILSPSVMFGFTIQF